MSIADEIEKLAALRDAGKLSEAEFARAKERLIDGVAGGPSPAQEQPSSSSAPPFASERPVPLLRRSVEDRWIGGVCGGLARTTGAESWVWRLLFAIAILCGGVGILPYVLMWIFVPLESPATSAASGAPNA